MATKNSSLSFKDKQNAFVVETDNQFKNLNLNQNYQCSVDDNACSKDFTTDNKKGQNYDFSQLNDLQSKKDSNLWKKSNNKHLSTTFLNLNQDSEEENKEFKEEKSANNSTLSLHIAAYENDSNECGEKKMAQKSLVKKWGTLNHFFDGSKSIIQDPFEFPRQQETEAKKPETMQFSASQRLLNPNQMDQPLSCIRENINQLIKNPDTAIFVQVQACIVPKYEKVPSMYTIPAEFPPSKSSSSSTSSLASTSSSKTTTTKTQK